MKLKRGGDCLELFLLPFLLLLTSLIALQCRDSAGFCLPLQAVLWPLQGQAGVKWSNLRPAGTWWNLQPVRTWWICFGPGETSWDLVEPAGGALWPMAIILLRGEHCHFVIIDVNIFETICKIPLVHARRLWHKMVSPLQNSKKFWPLICLLSCEGISKFHKDFWNLVDRHL